MLDVDESMSSNYREISVAAAQENPDLVVADTSWAPTAPAWNRTLTITATVRNPGCRPVVEDWWGEFLYDGLPLDILLVSDRAASHHDGQGRWVEGHGAG